MKVGDVLDERYELVRCIGGGGMGAVWEAYERPTDRRVAIKALHDHLIHETDLVARFLREARAALESQYSGHIIEVIDVVHPPERAPYQVMEFLEGEDLARILEREGPFEPSRAAELVIQGCHAVAEVHRQGIIHRDVKPENLFLVHLADGSEWIKLLDFGVAKFRVPPDSEERPLTEAGSTLGTPYYMAPEQVLVSQTLDHQLDVYSMGVVLYELLTGERPYVSDDLRDLMIMIARGKFTSPREIRPDLGEGLEAVVVRAMAKDKDVRYQTMFDLAEALEPFAHPGDPRGSDLELENVNTVIERAVTDPVAAMFDDSNEPPTSPSLPAVFDQEAPILDDPEAPTQISVTQIDGSDIEGEERSSPSLIAAMWRERSRGTLLLAIGLGLLAALIAFLVAIAILPDGGEPGETPPPAARPPAPAQSSAPETEGPASAALAGAAPASPDAARTRPVATTAGAAASKAPDILAAPEKIEPGAREKNAAKAGDKAPVTAAASRGDQPAKEGRKSSPPPLQPERGRQTGPLTDAEIRQALGALQPEVHRCLGSSNVRGESFTVWFKILADGDLAFLRSTPRTQGRTRICLRRVFSGKSLRRPSGGSVTRSHVYPLPQR